MESSCFCNIPSPVDKLHANHLLGLLFTLSDVLTIRAVCSSLLYLSNKLPDEKFLFIFDLKDKYT